MKKVYVEFNGLPGCGKSTLCQEIRQKLAASIPVIMLDQKKGAEPKGLPHFLGQLFSAAIHGQAGMIWDYLLFTLKLPKGTSRRWTCFYSSVRDYCVTLRCFRQEKQGVFLCDQGIMQHFLSGFFDQQPQTGMKAAQRIMRRAERDFSPFLEINLNLEPVISLERMAGRKEKASRLERLAPEEAAHTMMQQHWILTGLRKNLCDPDHTMEADALELPSENADLIVRRILKGMREAK